MQPARSAALVAAITLGTCVPQVFAATTPEAFEVTVKGSGATIADARQDAIRQAIQQTMVQLVVVDREIKDDAIVQDKVMSTMNGFVEAFDEISISRVSDRVELVVNVTVSTTSILNYIHDDGVGGSKIPGESVFAEARRGLAQQNILGEMLERYFRGFPSDAYRTELTGIRVIPENPDYLEIRVNISIREPFLAALRSFLQTVAIHQQTKFRTGDTSGALYNRNFPGSSPVCLLEGSEFRAPGSPEMEGICYFLPPGAYFRNFSHYLNSRGLRDNTGAFFLAFYDAAGKVVGPPVTSSVDESGTDTATRDACFLFNRKAVVAGHRTSPSPFIFSRIVPIAYLGDNPRIVEGAIELDLFLAPASITVEIPVSTLDLQSVEGAVGLAVVGVKSNIAPFDIDGDGRFTKWFTTDLGEPPLSHANTCERLAVMAGQENDLR